MGDHITHIKSQRKQGEENPSMEHASQPIAGHLHPNYFHCMQRVDN